MRTSLSSEARPLGPRCILWPAFDRPLILSAYLKLGRASVSFGIPRSDLSVIPVSTAETG